MICSKYIFGLVAIKLSENKEGLVANTSIYIGILITALTYEHFSILGSGLLLRKREGRTLFEEYAYSASLAPKRLGVHDPAVYPESTQILKLLAVPFWKKCYKN